MDSADMLAAARLLELEIDPSLRDGVAANLALLLDHARSVMAFPLDDAESAAPVFRP